MTATLSPLHWKETDPRCFGNLVPETGEFLRGLTDYGYKSRHMSFRASDGDAVAVTLERSPPPGVSGILFPKLGSFLGASDGDAVAVTLERNPPPVFRESCSRNRGSFLGASDLGVVAVTLERNPPPVFRESCSRNGGVS